LPGKVLREISGMPMLLHCVRRIERAQHHGKVIIATTINPNDDIIANFCNREKIECFRGNEQDVLDRYYQASIAYSLDVVIRITSDCPLIDPSIIDKCVEVFLSTPRSDYVSNTSPKRTFPRGLDVEVISSRALSKAWQEDTRQDWREHVTPFIRYNPHIFRSVNIIDSQDLSDIRLTVDQEEDLHVIRNIKEHFPHDNGGWRDIVSLIKKNPHLLDENANVEQRRLFLSPPPPPPPPNSVTIVNIDKIESQLPLVLGTAQLGMNYGLTNKIGKPSLDSVVDIIRTAWNEGIRFYDTAQKYGDSEKNLGYAMSKLGLSEEAKIITKLDPALSSSDEKLIEDYVSNSLKLLKVPALYSLMLHNPKLIGDLNNGLRLILEKMKESSLVNYLGVSVYTTEDAEDAIYSDVFDIIQIPANVFDGRFSEEGIIENATKKGIRVYMRSIFLQGLIFMNPNNLPDNLNQAKKYIDKLESISTHLGLTRRELALLYVKTKYPYCHILFGAESSDQVAENIQAWKKPILNKNIIDNIDDISVGIDESIINPSLWKLTKTL